MAPSSDSLPVSASSSTFFYDLGLEYLSVDARSDVSGVLDSVPREFDRTDLLLTLGHLIGERWVGFLGYRRGLQGAGFMRNDTLNEEGWFVGAGFSDIEIGATTLGLSIAYNMSTALAFIDDGSQDLDFSGLSVKLNLARLSAPQHTLQLRYQRFKGSESQDSGGSRVDYRFRESYQQLMYQYSFGAAAED